MYIRIEHLPLASRFEPKWQNPRRVRHINLPSDGLPLLHIIGPPAAKRRRILPCGLERIILLRWVRRTIQKIRRTHEAIDDWQSDRQNEQSVRRLTPNRAEFHDSFRDNQHYRRCRQSGIKPAKFVPLVGDRANDEEAK